MRFRLFKNPYKESLEASAKMMRPSDETCDKILDSVMLAAGVTGAMSFTAATAKVASFGKAAMLKTVATVTAVTTTVAAAGTVGVVMITPPSIQEVSIQQVSWSESSILITTSNGTVTKDVVIFPQEGGEPISATKVQSGKYQVDVNLNGMYQVEVTGQGGQRVSADVQVTSIDDQNPYMEQYALSDETVTLFFIDDRSGVNWDTIYALDSDGNVIDPVAVDPYVGSVTFQVSEGSLDVFVEDLAGNKGKTTVDVM